MEHPSHAPDDGMRTREARVRTARQYAIVAGAVLAAAVAGVGVVVIDYPWHSKPARLDAPSRAERIAAPATAPETKLPAAVAGASEDVAPMTFGNVAAMTPSRPAPPPAAVRGPKTRTRAAVPVVSRRAESVVAAPVVIHAPPPASPAPALSATTDQRYNELVGKECHRGARGLPCREVVRWKLCGGRWSEHVDAGANRCYVRKDRSEFRQPVLAVSDTGMRKPR